MRRAVSRSLGLCLALLVGTVSAQTRTPDALEWICALDPPRLDTIRCERWELVPGYHAGASGERPDTQRVQADLFRRGADANVARLVREAPERYAGEAWWIPLYTAPQNMAKVRELAEGVMCGKDRACRVIFAGPGLRAAALDARH